MYPAALSVKSFHEDWPEQPSSEQPSSQQPSSEQPSSEQPSSQQPSSDDNAIHAAWHRDEDWTV